jgi:hypothetical protein
LLSDIASSGRLPSAAPGEIVAALPQTYPLFPPIWTGEGEVPWFILNHEEIGIMQLIEVYKPT